MINQLMVDIETLGTRSNSVILSIGAIMFDIETGETGENLFVAIDPNSCIERGLTIDANTVLWWLNQSKNCQNNLLNVGFREDLIVALGRLSNLIIGYSPEGIWGNSNRFDLGLLENAYDACGIKTPWPFWAERDVRTLVSFAPQVKNECVNDRPHEPISDCLHQINYCTKIYQSLTKTKPALVTGQI